MCSRTVTFCKMQVLVTIQTSAIRFRLVLNQFSINFYEKVLKIVIFREAVLSPLYAILGVTSSPYPKERSPQSKYVKGNTTSGGRFGIYVFRFSLVGYGSHWLFEMAANLKHPIYRPSGAPGTRNRSNQEILVPDWLITRQVISIMSPDWLFTCFGWFLQDTYHGPLVKCVKGGILKCRHLIHDSESRALLNNNMPNVNIQ
eukprot:sb/3470642/